MLRPYNIFRYQLISFDKIWGNILSTTKLTKHPNGISYAPNAKILLPGGGGNQVFTKANLVYFKNNIFCFTIGFFINLLILDYILKIPCNK